MLYKINSLSSFDSRSLKIGIDGFDYKQFKRYYPGNYAINFSTVLSGANDFKVKNYTNFCLTNLYKASDIISQSNEPLKAKNVFGPIRYGTEYLTFSNISPEPYAIVDKYYEYENYGIGKFSNSENENTNFTFVVNDDNVCQIYHTKNYIKYYLCLDIDNNVVFVKESSLNFTNSVDPQDFHYLYSERDNYILLFKKTENGVYLITKSDDYLDILPILGDDIFSYLTNPFKLSKNLFNKTATSLDYNSITYDIENNIDLTKCDFSLENNYLIHRNYSDIYGVDNILVLKNQLLNNDVSTSANNLLSTYDYSSYTNKLREYSSISQNIPSENDDGLILNYIFYNQYYDILPGSNTFFTPSSMNPFESLNINDTKFVECGAFSHLSPEYSDKIYHNSKNPSLNHDGQYLLCTWLSGSPFSNDKVWVDRYYYPDLIEKSNALTAKPIFNPTYDDYIESLIENNTNSIKDTISKDKIFDKISDLSFAPNESYTYERINFKRGVEESITNTCNTQSQSDRYNYFKEINKRGEFTLSFNFEGDDTDWIIESDRNVIDGGIRISKIGDDISFELKLYDATTYDINDALYIQTTTTKYNKLKDNFLCVSINTKSEESYFFLNDSIINHFQIPQYQFLIKKILFGDLFIIQNDTKTNLLNSSSNFKNLNILSDYTDPSTAFTLHLVNDSVIIDPITISLPCGMRNSCDDINILHSISNSSLSKSNNINIYVKNLNISNQSVLKNLDSHIRSTIKSYLPVNVDINSVEFVDFK